MEIVVITALVMVAVLVVIGDRARRRTPTRVDAPIQRSRMEAEAEMEEHDIDDMLDAINERRRRRGARDIGEELGDELQRGTWEED